MKTRIELNDGTVLLVPDALILNTQSGSVTNQDGYLVATLTISLVEVKRVTKEETNDEKSE